MQMNTQSNKDTNVSESDLALARAWFLEHRGSAQCIDDATDAWHRQYRRSTAIDLHAMARARGKELMAWASSIDLAELIGVIPIQIRHSESSDKWEWLFAISLAEKCVMLVRNVPDAHAWFAYWIPQELSLRKPLDQHLVNEDLASENITGGRFLANAGNLMVGNNLLVDGRPKEIYSFARIEGTAQITFADSSFMVLPAGLEVTYVERKS